MNKPPISNLEIVLFAFGIIILFPMLIKISSYFTKRAEKYKNDVGLDYIEKFKVSIHPPNEFHPHNWHLKYNGKYINNFSRYSFLELQLDESWYYRNS